MSFASLVFITSLWVEVATASQLQIVGVLTTTSIPTIIICTVVIVLEVINSSLRAAGYLILPVVYADVAVVLFAMVGALAYIVYCAVVVFRFTRGLKMVNRRDRVLRNFSIRVTVSSVGVLGSLIGTLLYGLGYGLTPVGDTALQLAYMGFGSVIATAQLLALFSRPTRWSRAATPVGVSSGGNNSATSIVDSAEIGSKSL